MGTSALLEKQIKLKKKVGLVTKERRGAQAEKAPLGNLGSLKRQEICLSPENTLKPECVMESEMEDRRGSQPLSIRETLKNVWSPQLYCHTAKLTGTK